MYMISHIYIVTATYMVYIYIEPLNRYRPPQRPAFTDRPAAGALDKNRTTLNIYLESCLAINLEGYLGIYLERHLLGHML